MLGVLILLDHHLIFDNNGIQVKRKHIFNINEITNVIDEVKQEFKDRVEGLEMTGSGWK